MKFNKNHITLFTAILFASWTVFNPNVNACTGMKLTAQDGSVVNGRTLEFGVEVDSQVVVVPRNFEFAGTTPKGPGLKYKAKYAALGMIAFDDPAIMDGINEEGLAIGTFYFPGYAGYTPITAENQSKALSPVEFSNWVLTQFATLQEVIEGLQSVVIAPTVSKGWGTAPPPFHYIVYDKNGHALVIEPMDGKFRVYENPIGVLTNSPTFDWHLTNLRNFINLSPENVPPITLSGVELAPFGQGSGMVGLVGDFTPPSRFIRAAIFSGTAIPSKNAESAVFQLFHILNQFDIPVGAVRQVNDGVTHSDSTLATSVKDPHSLKYYFRTYDDQSIKYVPLKTFDLNAKSIKKAETTGMEKAYNISDSFK